MTDYTTEKTWNPNTKSWDTREVYAKQEQGEYKKPLSSEADANRGVKVMFKKDEPAAEPDKSKMSLAELTAYNKKKRADADAKAAGQKKALSEQ